MNKMILMASATFLAGCVSVESVEQREPVFAADTTKSAKVYADCVHERWANAAPLRGAVFTTRRSLPGPALWREYRRCDTHSDWRTR